MHCQHCSYWVTVRSFYSSMASLENANLSAVKWKLGMWDTLQQLQLLSEGAAGYLVPSPLTALYIYRLVGLEFVHLSHQEIVWSLLTESLSLPTMAASSWSSLPAVQGSTCIKAILCKFHWLPPSSDMVDAGKQQFCLQLIHWLPN